jgi:hypothetical protein
MAKDKDKEKKAREALAAAQKEVDTALEKLLKDAPDRYASLVSGEEEIKKLFASEQGAKVKRNPLLLGKLMAQMRTALYGVDKDFNSKSPEGRLLGNYQRARLSQTETGVSRASIFRYDLSYRKAVELFGEPVVIAMANDPRMIGVQISPDNPLGRFTKVAEKHKKLLDADKPASLEVVLNAPKPVGTPRTADEDKEAFHKTALRTVKSILRKESKTMDLVTARNVMLEVSGYLLSAFDLKGKQPVDALELPNDEYKTWEAFTKIAPASGSAMEATEHFGHYFGRFEPKNQFAASTPWVVWDDTNPKKLKVADHARSKQEAASKAKTLFEKSEAAKAARAAKKSKTDDQATGTTAGA